MIAAFGPVEALEMVNAIELKNCVLRKAKLRAYTVESWTSPTTGTTYPETITVTFSYEAPDRDTGNWAEIESVRGFDLFKVGQRGEPRRVFSDQLMQMIRDAFEHEFRECFHVDGVRVLDPHAGERAR